MPDDWINPGFDIVTKDDVGDIAKALKDRAVAQKRYAALAGNSAQERRSQCPPADDLTKYDIKSINELNPPTLGVSL